MNYSIFFSKKQVKEQFIFHVRNTEYIFIGIPTAAKKQHNGICADVLF